MKAAAVITLALAAGPALALTPAAPCLVSGATQMQVTPEAYAAAPDAPEHAEIYDIVPLPRVNGFVDWNWKNDNGMWMVLHHCTTDKYLMIMASQARVDRIWSLYDQMIDSEEPYTLQQMSEALAAKGALTRIGQGDIGRCDCVVNGM